MHDGHTGESEHFDVGGKAARVHMARAQLALCGACAVWPLLLRCTHDLRRSTKSGTVSKSDAFSAASFARCAAIRAFSAPSSASLCALYS